MYKLLLCWRYLRTRYIALACIVSVTLGVATMIVVNAVMEGFSHEMQKRINGILSDLVMESNSATGYPDPQARMDEIMSVAGEHIECLTPTVSVPAMLSFRFHGQWFTRPVTVVGIPENQPLAGDFAEYLQHPENRKNPSFSLRDGGYDTMDHQAGPEAKEREAMAFAGWEYRRWKALRDKEWQTLEDPSNTTPGIYPERSSTDPLAPSAYQGPYAPVEEPLVATESSPTGEDGEPTGPPPPSDAPLASGEVHNPFITPGVPQENIFDPATEQESGTVLGFALATYRDHAGDNRFAVLPGDDIKLTMPTAGIPPRAVDASFTVVDLYESKMHEYDSSFVFVPLARLQQLRGMFDPTTGLTFVTAIQIKLKDPTQGKLVQEKLIQSGIFPPEIFRISTWRDKQGPLLAAVQMETAILNVLLFLIIAVAGFGILAIFFMIVVEKTRDIGILKSLGAGSTGVLGIFLGYGLSLGIVGAGAGAIGGLMFVWNINEIADWLSWLSGHEVFDPTIYYFYEIPAIVEPWTVAWVTLGAVAIAVLASVLPALRAARLHPVEALRWE
jgi:lipoprotein-releasing system permease protein